MAAIKIQRKIPCNKGFTPTDFKVFIFKVAPIKNKVMVKPILAIATICGAMVAVAGIYVFKSIAKINKPIK